jgi:AcrR family transcriptional regulator
VGKIVEEERGRRRRGAVLETAILDATWEELAAVGYAQLTMEGVAARAGTGKQVLYRRWRNRAELVLAAVRHRVTSITESIPDTGDLRGDVMALLQRVAQRYREMGPDVAHGLLAEVHDLEPEFRYPLEAAMTTVLKRAVERGEIRSDAVTPRIAVLPVDLVRHEILLTHRPVSEHTMTEIVDDVFLPLVRRKG